MSAESIAVCEQSLALSQLCLYEDAFLSNQVLLSDDVTKPGKNEEQKDYPPH